MRQFFWGNFRNFENRVKNIAVFRQAQHDDVFNSFHQLFIIKNEIKKNVILSICLLADVSKDAYSFQL